MENRNLAMFKLLYKKRWYILAVTFLGVLIGVVLTMPRFMPPKFKSTAYIYPTNISPYSEESATEQLMQFITAKDIKDIMDKKFDLIGHYGLDRNDPKMETYYSYLFDENIQINQTRFESIKIEVYDKDPKMAQTLAYGVIESVNEHIRTSLNSKTEEFLEMHRLYLKDKERKMDSIAVLLRKQSSENGLLDYELQIEQLSKNYYEAVMENKTEKFTEILKKFGENGIQFQNLLEQYKADIAYYNESKQEYDKGVRDIKKKFTYTTIASKPTLPQSKASPKRSFFVLVGGIGALLFACLFFVFASRFKELKSELAKD